MGNRPLGPVLRLVVTYCRDFNLLNGGGRSSVFALDPIHAAGDQTARIQQVLRAETALGPAAAIVEFNPQEIADLPEDTVFYFPAQFAVWIADVEGGAERYRPIYLQTSAGKRNVLQIGHTPAAPSVGVLPLDIDQIRTQHSRLNSAIHHSLLVLSDR